MYFYNTNHFFSELVLQNPGASLKFKNHIILDTDSVIQLINYECN
jgi:hypothetical protein